jgi:hypothetical protein
VIIVILFCGCAYGSIWSNTLGPAMALAAIATPFLLALAWIGDRSGTTSLVIGSVKFLSGADSPDGVVSCNPSHPNSGTALLMVWVGVVVVIAGALAGLFGMLGLPLALAVSVAGGLKALSTSDSKLLKKGLGFATVTLLAVIVWGLLYRLEHGITHAYASC